MQLKTAQALHHQAMQNVKQNADLGKLTESYCATSKNVSPKAEMSSNTKCCMKMLKLSKCCIIIQAKKTNKCLLHQQVLT